MTDFRDTVFTEIEWQSLHDLLGLPTRQQQVIRKLFNGLSDKQIADELSIAVPTVRSHLQRLYTRFKVQDRTELVLFIVRTHLQSVMALQKPINNDDVSGNDV